MIEINKNLGFLLETQVCDSMIPSRIRGIQIYVTFYEYILLIRKA